MKRVWTFIIGLSSMGMVLLSSCTEGINDYSDAAKVSGRVFTDGTESHGVAGVAVLLESDQESDEAYTGPDRWFYTDKNGHFEGSLFLGSERNATTGKETYRYVADVAISYYYEGKYFSWSGGATVQAGGNFICPSVNLTQFILIGSGGGG
ncbi:MAG: hypothetical protein V1784_04535 [bacterium]